MTFAWRNPTLGYQGYAAVHHLSDGVEQGLLIAVVGANPI